MDEFVINAASPAIVTNQGLEQAVSFFSEQTCRHLLVLADPHGADRPCRRPEETGWNQNVSHAVQ